MTTGQTLLAIGSMVLLGKLAISTNTFVTDTDTMQLQMEAVTTATSLGQSVLEKISVRGYDHNFPGGNDTVTALSFVPAAALGVDAGEVAGRDTTFNDVDDFKGFTDSVDTPRFGKFYVTCDVYYANETPPYDSTGTRTFLKRIDVSIRNVFMVDPDDPLKLPVPITVSRYIAYN